MKAPIVKPYRQGILAVLLPPQGPEPEWGRLPDSRADDTWL